MKQEIYTREGLREVTLNRRKAIRFMCMDCSGFEFNEVANCEHKKCPLYSYRMGTGKQNPKERNRAIKDYCLDCMVGKPGEISQCVSVNCPLLHYRGYNRIREASGLPKKHHLEAFREAKI